MVSYCPSMESRRPQSIIEPFAIHTVEPLPMTTREQRTEFLRKARFNPFGLRAREITIDLLTDSGTGAMSTAQWAAMMTGDETYAGSESYYELRDVVQDLTGMAHVIPTHQGRAAEHILFASMGIEDRVVLANSHFDTTRANVEYLGGEARDLLIQEGHEPGSEHPFKGNIDLRALEQALEGEGHRVACVVMTLTNNSGGGQPASLQNIREASRLARKHGKPLVLDAARFAENAWFIKEREPGQGERSPRDIAREFFRLGDCLTMSAKKDGLVNMGGLLCVNDDDLAERCRSLLILTEGFPTYGGLAGRDLAALAQGLREVTDEDYLRYRTASIKYFFKILDRAGVPLMRPPGGHAVFIDAGALYPHIKPWEYPGLSLCNELYLEGGVRGVEIGTLMFGRPDPKLGRDSCAPLELVRLTFPRRRYTQSHVDWLAEIVIAVAGRRDDAPGYRITRQGPILRAFTAELEPSR